jgi:predicted N-formylglutamate amidohydrolase
MTTYTYLEAEEPSPFLVVCDHASAVIPDEFGKDSLSPQDASRHIAYDIGAAEVTRLLYEALPAHAFLANVSRLVVDLNRDTHCDDVIPEASDGTVLPFNQNLSDAARRLRLINYHAPYHAALNSIAKIHAELHGEKGMGILVHSFTPALSSIEHPRPWHIGLLWRDDEATARKLKAWLEANTDYVIGDNEPYTAFSEASYTMRKHFGELSIPHIAIEIRQDLINHKEGQEKMAALLADAFKAIQT